MTTLIEACKRGDLALVKKLVKEGHNVNAEHRQSNPQMASSKVEGISTPLMEASRVGNSLIVRYLLECNADMSKVDFHGRTALHHACERGHLDIVKSLISNRANIDAEDDDGQTPLMMAAKSGHHSAVETLILYGASVDKQNKESRTALHLAAKHNHLHCGFLLIEDGASIKIKDSRRQTPIDYASSEFKSGVTLALSFSSRKIACVIGNAYSGKSTLIAALQSEQTTFSRKVSNRIFGVKDNRRRTAGIEPVSLSSERYGNVTFFDFAGQHEYHGPHEMFLESILTGSTVTIILVVKVTDEEFVISQQLYRWLSPISKMCSSTSPVRVIVVGSFLDKVKSKTQAKDKLSHRYQMIQADLKDAAMEFRGTCFLNCRQPYSSGIDQLCLWLNEVPTPQCKAAKTQYSISWVISRVNHTFDQKAIKLGDFSKWMNDNKADLSANLPSPQAVCSDLSTTGHFLYLPNKVDSSHGWLILDLAAILRDVYGSISPFKKIVDQFGLFKCHDLSYLFPTLDEDMIHNVLIALEFCIEVDPTLLSEEIMKLKGSEKDDFLFFPALVSDKPPEKFPDLHAGIEIHTLCWQLQADEKHFISPRLLQTILLRLAAHQVFHHQLGRNAKEHCCSVWWNGISWQSPDGVDAAVQISDNDLVQVLGRSTAGPDVLCKCISEITSDIITTILQLFPDFSANSYIIRSSDPISLLKEPRNISSHNMFPVTRVLSIMTDGEEFCFSLDQSSRKTSVTDLFSGVRPSLDTIQKLCFHDFVFDGDTNQTEPLLATPTMGTTVPQSVPRSDRVLTTPIGLMSTQELNNEEVEANKTQPLLPPVKHTKDTEITMEPTSSPPTLDGSPSDSDLVKVLDIVPEWYNLAVALGVPVERIEQFKQIKTGGIEALYFWRCGESGQNFNTSWRFLLDKIEECYGQIVVRDVKKVFGKLSDSQSGDIVENYKDQFLSYVNAHAIAQKLEIKNVIPNRVYHKIENSAPEDAKKVLFLHLRSHSSPETLNKLCDVMIGMNGYPKMSTFGRTMKKDLPSMIGMFSPGSLDIDPKETSSSKYFETETSPYVSDEFLEPGKGKEERAAQQDSLHTEVKKAFERGAVDVKIVKCISMGPPEAGKTQLKHALLGDFTPMKKSSDASTQGTPAVEIIVAGEQKWKTLDFKQLQSAMQTAATNKDVPQRSTSEDPQTNLHKHTQSSNRESTPEDHTPADMDPSHIDDSLHKDSFERIVSTYSSQVTNIDQFHNLKEKVEKTILQSQLSEAEINVHGAKLIYTVDSGGQPSFLDFHPVTATFAATYLLLYNMEEGLDAKPKVTYWKDYPTKYSSESTQSNLDIVRRSLFTLHHFKEYYCEKYERLTNLWGDKFKPTTYDPPIIIIGTGRKESTLKQDEERLRSECQQIPSMERVQLSFVNSLDPDREEIKRLQHLVCANPGIFQFPLSWFQLLLMCLASESGDVPEHERIPGIFTFLELRTLCLKEELVSSNDEFKAMVTVFHSLGVFSCHDLDLQENVEDSEILVFINPGLLFADVTKILEIPFQDLSNVHDKQSLFYLQQSGELTTEALEELGISNTLRSSPRGFHERLVKWLVHWGLAAEMEEGRRWFIPSVLPPRSSPFKSIVRKNSFDPFPLSICFLQESSTTFAFHYLPEGLFPHFVVQLVKSGYMLLKNKGKYTCPPRCRDFMYLTRQRDPNVPAFNIDLIDKASHLLVDLTPAKKKLIDTPHLGAYSEAGAILAELIDAMKKANKNLYHHSSNNVAICCSCPCGEFNEAHLAKILDQYSLLHCLHRNRLEFWHGVCNDPLKEVIRSFLSHSDRVGGDLSAQLGEEYKAVVEQNACITLQISKCITIGSPCVGKTHLKYLLIDQKWDREKGTASTDAMEAHEWVEVFHQDEHNNTWTHLNRETRKDNLMTNIACANLDQPGNNVVNADENKKDRTDSNNIQRVQSNHDEREKGSILMKDLSAGQDNSKTNELKETSDDELQPIQSEEEKNVIMGSEQLQNSEAPKFDHEKPSRAIEDLMKRYNDENFQLQLENAKTQPISEPMQTVKYLHFVDTGSQPIYYDVHPVLITSPSVYLVVINLIDYAREYNLPYHDQLEGESSEGEKSSQLSKDPNPTYLTDHVLRSIPAFTSKKTETSDNPYFQVQLNRRKIFIIGTHLDQIFPHNPEERRACLQKLNDIIKGQIKGKPCSRFIQYDDKLRCFWAVDNTLAGDENLRESNCEMYKYLCRLRNLIQEKSMTFCVRIPIKWQLFAYLTSKQSHFKYKELCNFAHKMKFADPETGEFKLMLRIFHILGLYFFKDPIPLASPQSHVQIEDTIIFTDPGALYKATTELLWAARECYEKTQGSLVHVKSILTDLISREKIIDVDIHWFSCLLCDLRLMAQMDVQGYVIPAVLPVRQAQQSELNVTVGPLLVTFTESQSQVSFIPSGLFCALISDLLTRGYKGKSLFRNYVVLISDELPNADLYLIKTDFFIEIHCSLYAIEQSVTSLQELSAKCMETRQFLHDRITFVWSQIYEDHKIFEDIKSSDCRKVLTWGFPCKFHPHNTHIAKFWDSPDSQSFCAQCSDSRFPLIQDVPDTDLVWFSEIEGTLEVKENLLVVPKSLN